MRKSVRAAGYARPVGLDASDFPLPDSEFANQATRLVRELSPGFLFNLGVRVFMFGMDVVGFRAEDVSRAFSEVLQDEVRRKPSSHMAGHLGLGFVRMIRSAPFAQ